MNEQIKKLLDDVFDQTPDWSYWESHTFENALTDEGEYIKVEDAYDAMYSLAEKIVSHYEQNKK